jgi:hypothetical protein
MPTVELLKYRENVQLVLADTGPINQNYPMVVYDTKVYKGITNKIDFVIRDTDRKPINLSAYTLTAIVQTVDEPNYNPPMNVLTKRVFIIDDIRGRAQLVLEPEDVQHLRPGFYHYSIQATDVNGINEFLFTNSNRDAIGQFELIEGVAQSLVPPQIFYGDKFTQTPVGYFGIIYSTGAIQGDAQSGRANGTHTVALYTREFSGKFWIQASLLNNAPLHDDWFDIKLGADHNHWEVCPFEHIRQFTFFGNYYWIRFRYQIAGQNTGFVDKVLYKN